MDDQEETNADTESKGTMWAEPYKESLWKTEITGTREEIWEQKRGVGGVGSKSSPSLYLPCMIHPTHTTHHEVDVLSTPIAPFQKEEGPMFDEVSCHVGCQVTHSREVAET